ncbi:hypothetical protein JT359_00615 [Candidatus Poribacteria bacterium]|nr:hypothetical protein [Candidatus Poribacteria bacterium]
MTDKDLITHSNQLHKEASILLNNEGLLPLLCRYGTTHVIGSYALNTMTWPDIDISIELPNPQDVDLFFEIGKTIASKFMILKMSYSNHFIRNFANFDHGLYWGIQLKFADTQWKIDVWGYDKQAFTTHMFEFNEFKSKLTQIDRTTILRIKHPISHRPDYRGDVYNSMAIYNAILQDKVSSLNEFKTWIERNSNVNT